MTAYSFFPISPERILIRICNGVEKVQGKVALVTWFDKELLQRPNTFKGGKYVKFHVNHVYSKNVKRINAARFSGALEGIAFRNKAAVSIEEYPSINEYYKQFNY